MVMSVFQDIKKECQNVGKGTHYVILSHSEPIEQLVGHLRAQLKQINKMKNAYKRKELNDRIYSIVCTLEDQFVEQSPPFNGVILCNAIDNVQMFRFGKKKVAHFKEYNVRTFSIFGQDTYHYDFLQGTIANSEFKYLGRIDKDLLCVIEANPWKWKLILEKSCKDAAVLQTVLDDMELSSTGIIYGGSPHLKKIKHNSKWVVVAKRIEKVDAFQVLREEDAKKLHEQLTIAMSIINNENEMHKAIFGNLDVVNENEEVMDINRAIEEYRVQDLYIHETLLDKLHERFDAECLNFKIHVVTTVCQGDAGDDLLRNYSGIFGVAYY